MIINAIIEQQKKVRVRDEELKKIVLEVVHAATNFPTGAAVTDDGQLVKWEEYHGGPHSWDEKIVIRKATEHDLAVDRILNDIENYFAERGI